MNFYYFLEVRGITNRKTVIEGYENVQAALLDYTLTCYPSVTVSPGFNLDLVLEFNVFEKFIKRKWEKSHCHNVLVLNDH